MLNGYLLAIITLSQQSKTLLNKWLKQINLRIFHLKNCIDQ